ncbi:hypothetical protein ACLOJK_005044 [Asimina triloba]
MKPDIVGHIECKCVIDVDGGNWKERRRRHDVALGRPMEKPRSFSASHFQPAFSDIGRWHPRTKAGPRGTGAVVGLAVLLFSFYSPIDLPWACIVEPMCRRRLRNLRWSDTVTMVYRRLLWTFKLPNLSTLRGW